MAKFRLLERKHDDDISVVQAGVAHLSTRCGGESQQVHWDRVGTSLMTRLDAEFARDARALGVDFTDPFFSRRLIAAANVEAKLLGYE